MAPRKAAKAVTKALRRAAAPVPRKRAPKTSPYRLPVRTIAIVVGIAGLAALAAALLGSRRLRDEYVQPLSAATLVPLAAAVAPQADRVWAEIRPWRDQVSRILASVNTRDVREALADRLSDWLARFR